MPILKETKLSNFTISINDCIALCYIVDEFESFTKNLADFSKGKRGYSNLKKIYNHIKEGKRVNKHIRNFYCKNYVVLDAIHKNTFISNFLLIYFNQFTGKFNKEITQMFEYIKNNKVKKEKILENLEKLSKLGFENIEFAENQTFKNVYEYDKFADSNYFVDGNIEIIPSIEAFEYKEAGVNSFKYKTNNANYEIEFSTIPFHNAKITLNNLVFDSNFLPESLQYDNTMKKIIDLREQKQDSYNVLNTSVKLGYHLGVIDIAIEKIDDLIIGIQNCPYKNRTKEYIDNAKTAINMLKVCLINYEKEIIKEDLIEEELLEKEKKYYNKRNSN